MKEYGYFQALLMSFYSRKIYRDVARNWGASVVFYLFLVLLICWAVMMFKYQPVINAGFRTFINNVSPQVPEMTIKEGILTTPEDRPYIIKDPDSNETIAVIDTSGEYTNMDHVPEGTSFLVTKDTTYYLNTQKTLKVNKISKSFSFEVVPEKIKRIATGFVGWLWVALLPFLLFMSLIYRLVQALFYAVIGKIFAKMSNVILTYSQILKLTMVAMTPAIVFATIIDWFNMMFRFEWLVCFLIAMVYLLFAIGANKDSNQ